MPTKKKRDAAFVWKSQIRSLFEEIMENGGPAVAILHTPLRITYGILRGAAKRAAELQDDEMIGWMCRLGLYEFSDPAHKDFDEKRTDKYIALTNKSNPNGTNKESEIKG